MARVDDDRQVAGDLDHGHRTDVERVARRRLEGADAALAEDHVAVAFLDDVLGRHEQLLDGGRGPALEEHRLVGLPDLREQQEVLRVARADLQHVGELADDVEVARVHHLGDDRQPRVVARRGEHARPSSPRPWKA